MPINFPSAPTLNDTYTYVGKTWEYNNTGWELVKAFILDDHDDVNITTLTANELLKFNGTNWINMTFAEAGVSAVGHSHVATDITDFDAEVANNAAVAANTAKVSDINHNVTTNLSYSTGASSGSVNSSDGANATIPAATTSLAGLQTGADKTKLNGIESNATADQTSGEIEAIVTHNNLQGVSANEHLDWTLDLGATNIHSGNYINTTYSVGDGGLTQINFTTAKDSKLTGIETSADVTDATNVAAALANGVAGLTSGEVSQLANIGGAVISAAEWGYVAGSGASFTSADNTKLDGIAAGATVNQSDATLKARANHTGTQLASTISDFAATAVAAIVGGITFTGRIISKTIRDTQYSLTGTVINPANGDIQYKTLGANTTFTESLSNGDSVLLMIDDGTAYTITWPTITWLTSDDSAPTLRTTGYNSILLFQMAGVVYGTVAKAG